MKKYCACYSGVGEWDIMLTSERERILSSDELEGDESKIMFLKSMIEFDTLKEAKDLVLGGLRCDRDDVNLQFSIVRKFKLK